MQFFCERCGGLFNLPPKSRGAKRRYCDECRPEVKAEYNREYISKYYKRKRDMAAKHDGTVERLRAAIQKHADAAARLQARLQRILGV